MENSVASFPGLLTPAFAACSTNTLVLQATNAGVRRPGNEAKNSDPWVFSQDHNLSFLAHNEVV